MACKAGVMAGARSGGLGELGHLVALGNAAALDGELEDQIAVGGFKLTAPSKSQLWTGRMGNAAPLGPVALARCTLPLRLHRHRLVRRKAGTSRRAASFHAVLPAELEIEND